MNTFKKRIYTVSGFFHDIIAVLKHPGLALGVLWGISLTLRFRERLFLAVISVNSCRYCTYVHTRSAMHAGLSQDDVNLLLDGVFDYVPIDEAKALLYAQHWADNDGQPDAQARADLIETYGSKQARVIEMALLLIRIGSLCGNTFDYCLFRLSCGRCGLAKREQS
jgi:AhpD family alkylhydroperoxidase